MKATINARGCLRISPDGDLEKYALLKWWVEYTKTDHHLSNAETKKTAPTGSGSMIEVVLDHDLINAERKMRGEIG